jgi:glycosyltransferase involved in cell wall biosynthesis
VKKVLCISPHFPPVNAVDMHRLRTALPYTHEFGWEWEIVSVKTQYVEIGEDQELLDTIPDDTKVHRLPAFSTTWTRKLGLGNLALRALPFYYFWLRRHLSENHYDLIYFSTTSVFLFPLVHMIKRKFNIPTVIDLQDPWLNTFYLDKPKTERPRKFWFDYSLRKVSEQLTIRSLDGITAVTGAYLRELEKRYGCRAKQKTLVLPFGAPEKDMKFAIDQADMGRVELNPDKFNIVYTGTIAPPMVFAVRILLQGIAAIPKKLRAKIRLSVIGTGYAKDHKTNIVQSLMAGRGYDFDVLEYPEREPYFTALYLQKRSDLLFLPGSMEKYYSASKLGIYFLTGKPILAIYNQHSELRGLFLRSGGRHLVEFDEDSIESELVRQTTAELLQIINESDTEVHYHDFLTASKMTGELCRFFDSILVDRQLEERN